MAGDGSASQAGGGTELPWYLRSTCTKFCALFLLSGCCTFAFGPTMSNQSFQPAMLDTGWGQCGSTNYGSSDDAGDEMDFINMVGNGVGMAASAKFMAATLNTPEHTIIDHKVVVLCGDGCLQVF